MLVTRTAGQWDVPSLCVASDDLARARGKQSRKAVAGTNANEVIPFLKSMISTDSGKLALLSSANKLEFVL